LFEPVEVVVVVVGTVGVGVGETDPVAFGVVAVSGGFA